MRMDKTFAVYARQSIDKADSISIETQIERCLIEVAGAPYTVYADRGYSGKNTDRPQFQKMLDALCRGEISCVVCYKLDRCSRSILDFTQLMNLFQQYDVPFISCTEKFDTTTPMGRAMLNICIVFAQLERETIQQRITDAYHSRCRKGYFMGGRVPFGFTLIPCYLDGKKTACYAVQSEEAEILRRIYSVYKLPSTSLADAVLDLNTAKITNPRRGDGLWVRPHIGRMIKNPIYVRADQQIYDYFEQRGAVLDNLREDYIGLNGCYLYRIGGEQHLVLAPHEGIVSSEDWLMCQRKSSSTGNRQRISVAASWLTGKLKCAKCGRAVITKQTVGKNCRVYRYFVCPSAQSKARSCDGFRPFTATKTETAIGDAIVAHIRFLLEREYPSVGTAGLLRELLKELECADASCNQLEQALTRLQDRMKFPHKDRQPDETDRLLTAQLSNWEDLTQEKKAQIAALMIETVELSDDRVTVIWHI